jgi:hypothetical protein
MDCFFVLVAGIFAQNRFKELILTNYPQYDFAYLDNRRPLVCRDRRQLLKQIAESDVNEYFWIFSGAPKGSSDLELIHGKEVRRASFVPVAVIVVRTAAG